MRRADSIGGGGFDWERRPIDRVIILQGSDIGVIGELFTGTVGRFLIVKFKPVSIQAWNSVFDFCSEQFCELIDISAAFEPDYALS